MWTDRYQTLIIASFCKINGSERCGKNRRQKKKDKIRRIIHPFELDKVKMGNAFFARISHNLNWSGKWVVYIAGALIIRGVAIKWSDWCCYWQTASVPRQVWTWLCLVSLFVVYNGGNKYTRRDGALVIMFKTLWAAIPWWWPELVKTLANKNWNFTWI